MSSCYHNRQGHVSRHSLASKPSGYTCSSTSHHVCRTSQRASGPRAGLRSASSGRDTRNSAASPHCWATPTSINRSETMALGSISILRFPIVALCRSARSVGSGHHRLRRRVVPDDVAGWECRLASSTKWIMPAHPRSASRTPTRVWCSAPDARGAARSAARVGGHDPLGR